MNPPGKNPPGKNPPGKNPPGKNPGNRPPGKNPGNRPPGKNPGNRPPGKNPDRPVQLPEYGNRPGRPPGNRPPGNRPPGNRPPNRPNRPPYYGGGYWRPNWHWHWHVHTVNWWAWASAGAVTGWVTTGFDQPYYYNYGDNIYYDEGNVYVEGAQVATAEEYAQAAQEIAGNVPEVDPEKVEWLPLGVFALVQKDGAISVEDSTIFLQLAISKEGIIAGTVQDTSAESATEVEGTIDKNSQRAAWGPVGKDWPIMETGIYNLTKEETGVLLHFENGATQQWNLVRLKEVEEEKPEKE